MSSLWMFSGRVFEGFLWKSTTISFVLLAFICRWFCSHQSTHCCFPLTHILRWLGRSIQVKFICIAHFIHPSIFYTRLIRRSGRGGTGAYRSGHRVRGRVYPGQVASPSQGHAEINETNNHARSQDNFRVTN